MSFANSHTLAVVAIVGLSLLVQFGFAIGMLGPAWLSPTLTLPAVFAVTWLWRRAEKQNQRSQAFARLVI